MVPMPLDPPCTRNVSPRRNPDSMNTLDHTVHTTSGSAAAVASSTPAGQLLAAYRRAQARLAVPWEYLAAIHLVETRVGRIRGTSSAGAQGPMQFLPATWRRYGRGGDIQATDDAILAAARLLRANGAPTDMARAMYAYNPSRRYVRAVSAYAGQLRANQRAFLGYYHWQVFYGDTLLPEGYPARPPAPAPAGSGGVVR